MRQLVFLLLAVLALACCCSSSEEGTGNAPTAQPAVAEDDTVRRARFRFLYEQAGQLRSVYDNEMYRNYTFGDTTLLRASLQELLTLESELRAVLTTPPTLEEKRFLAVILRQLQATYDDLEYIDDSVFYLRMLEEMDMCAILTHPDDARGLEHCYGYLYSRLIIQLRRQNKPEEARQAYNAALQLRSSHGDRIINWIDDWQIPPFFQPGLRSQPYWTEHLPIVRALEMQFSVIKAEFQSLLEKMEQSGVSWGVQSDFNLISSGSWMELVLHDGDNFSPLCSLVPKTCEFVRSRGEFMGTFPPDKLRSINIKGEAVIFKMTPGTRLKPHTGEINYHLVCHLPLIVPEGPRLRVGPGPAVEWEEGKALCFDDTYVHEAWHRGTQPRYVFFMTLWHPDLGAPHFEPPVDDAPALAPSTDSTDEPHHQSAAEHQHQEQVADPRDEL